MSYSEMTITELRKLCKERALPFPSKARKADLVASLERYDAAQPIEVEAVTVDGGIIPANALSIDVGAMHEAAVSLTATLDAAAKALREFDADDETIGGMSVGDIRVCEEGIATALRYVDESRKELTRMLTAPKKVIDDKCKEMTEPLRILAGRYADARDGVYMRGYEAQYEECCIANGLEALIDAVPFAEFFAKHPTWGKRNANPVKVQEYIADEVERVAKDWRTLQSMRTSMRFYDDAEIAFFDTLDVKAAIERNNQRTAEQQRIDAMNREREDNERWMAEQATQADADEIESFNRAIAKQQTNAYAPAFKEVEPEPATAAERPAEPASGDEVRTRYRFTVWLNDHELKSLREWKNATGIGWNWKFGR